MLTDELRNRLIHQINTDPQSAIREIQANPALLKILLESDQQLSQTQRELAEVKNERIKYVNMTAQTEFELKQKAEQLRTTQGALLGLGAIMLLSALDKKR